MWLFVDGMMLMKHSNLSKRDSRCLMNCIVIIVTLVPIATSGQSVVASFTHPSSGEQWDCYENITASSSICTACTVALSDSFGYNVTILWQNPPNPPFQLEANGIQWILKTPAFKIIDRETTSNFTFRFNATKGVSAIQSEVLTVVIKDINDNYPKFTNDAYELTIYNSLAEGTILTMQASDADESPTITYSITAGDANETFSIDPHTGQLNLTTFSNLNATTKPTYNLTVQASDGTNVNFTTVIIHVVDDLCVPSPCDNNGNCSRNHTNYKCTCAAGWLGDKCKEADPCFPAPCFNGSCHRNGTSFICSCSVGWSGETCNKEHVTDPCISTPCSNGTTCKRTGTNYTCDGPSGGQNNDSELANPCIPSPCLHGTTCERTDTNHTCISPSGLPNNYSEQADPCLSNPCQNGGVCAVNGTAFACRCTSGVTGSYCNETVPTTSKSHVDPCSSKPCTNGGTCIVIGTLFSCLCVSGMTGNLCSTIDAPAASQNATQDQESKSSRNLLAVYIVVPMLVVIGIVVAVIVIHKQKKRQKVANGNVQEGPRNQSFENSYVPNKELLRRNVPHLPPINISNTKCLSSQ